MEGARLLQLHEDELATTPMFRRGTATLPVVERTIKKIVQDGLCDGLLYVTVFQHGQHRIARILEHGTLDGDYLKFIFLMLY